MPQPDIHDLYAKVREHPDFAFGTIFVKEDFPNEEVPAGFPANRAQDAIVSAGNEFIEYATGEYAEED